MKQDHVILVWKFPENSIEDYMPYTLDEIPMARIDADLFKEMYPEVLYLQVIVVYSDSREENLFQWNNPQSAKLINLANNAGDVLNPSSTPWASAPLVGDYFPHSSRKLTSWQPGARPPLLEASAPPSPLTSKPYLGHPRATSRRPGRLR